MKYLILPLLLFICSCSMMQEAVKLEIIQKSYETEYSEVNAQLLQFKDESAEKVNKRLADELDSTLVGFDTEAAENKEVLNLGNRSIFQSTQTPKYNKNDFVSVLEEQYTYTGGAHGLTLRRGRNFDTLTWEEVPLEGLFEEEGWKEALNNYMQKLVEENPEEYGELWERPEIRDEQDYYITDTDLVIFYQPYVLSYYARGFVEFPIRLTEIRGYLKEDYYRLVSENY